MELSSLKKKFKHISKGLVKILTQLLKLDPKERLTAKQALSDSLFDDIRDEELEMPSNRKIWSCIEEPGMLDYDDFKAHSLSAPALVKLIEHEI